MITQLASEADITVEEEQPEGDGSDLNNKARKKKGHQIRQ